VPLGPTKDQGRPAAGAEPRALLERVGMSDKLGEYIDGSKIVEDGPPSQVIENPREERTRKFLGLVLEH